MKKMIYFILITISLFYSCGSFVTETEVYVASQDFVKEHLSYPEEADFITGSSIVEENPDNEYTIYAKFTSPNALGVDSKFLYKMEIKYLGGDWVKKSNWECKYLIIENLATGEQSRFGLASPVNSFVEKHEKNKAQIKQRPFVIFRGDTCQVVEETQAALRIKTSRKLSKKEIEEGLQECDFKDMIIYFVVEPKLDRGDEYASTAGEMVFYF